MRALTRSVIRQSVRMRWRTVGIALIVAWAMAMFVTGIYSADVMEHSMDDMVEEYRMPDAFLQFSSNQDMSVLNERMAEDSRVDAYQLRLQAYGLLEHPGGTMQALLIGMDDPGRQDINRLVLKQGELFSSSGECVALAGSEANGLDAGGTAVVSLAGEVLELQVTGTVTSIEFLMPSATSDFAIPMPGTLAVIYLPIEDLQAIVGDGANDLTFITDDGADAHDVVSDLQGYPIRSIVYQDTHPTLEFMDMAITEMRMIMPMISVVFMFIGVISIFMIVYRMIMNDSRYIGINMTLGYTRGDIVRAYLMMGLFIGGVGTVLGLLLSFGVSYWVVDLTMRMYFALNIDLPMLPIPFIVGALYSMGVVMASVAIPTLLVSRRSVKDALEYRPSIRVRLMTMGRNGGSKLTRMGVRNAVRHPSRYVLTVFAVGVAIGAAGSWVVLIDSSIGFMYDQIDEEHWDVRMDLLSDLPEDQIDASFIGVEPDQLSYVHPYTFLATQVSSDGVLAASLVMACDDLPEIRGFDVMEGEANFSGAVITNGLSRNLGVHPGDPIDIDLGAETITLPVTGVVADAMADSVYTRQTSLEPVVNASMCSGAYIGAATSGDIDSIVGGLEYNPMVSKTVRQTDIKASLDSIMDQSMGIFWGFYLLSSVIAFIVAASTVIVSTMERGLEYATLDTLGVSRWRVSWSILVEMMTITAGSLLVSIPVAWAVAVTMGRTYQEMIFYFPVSMSASTVAVILITGTAFVMMASIVPIRYARGLDTERALRERNVG